MITSSRGPPEGESPSTVLPSKPRGRRSNACLTCRQRRVKCDGRIPECLRCTTGFYQCLGYDRPRVFINQVLPSRPAASEVASHETTQLALTPSLGVPRTDVVVSHLIYKFPIDFPWRLPQTHGSATSALSKIFSIENKDTAIYLSGLSLAEAFFARVHRLGDLEAHAAVLYGQSLQRLGQDVQTLSHNPSTSTVKASLSSSFLLGLYEMVTSISPAGWMKHSAGVAALAQMLGPEAFQEIEPNAMFEKYRCLITISAVDMRKRCFLETPTWKTVPWRIKKKTLGSEIHDIFCDVPGLMEDVDNIAQRSIRGEYVMDEQGRVGTHIVNTLHQLDELRWRWEWQNPIACKEVSVSELAPHSSYSQGLSPFVTVLHFYELDHAIDIAFFNAIYILLHTVLGVASPFLTSLTAAFTDKPFVGPSLNPLLLPGPESIENRALEICRIVDFMSRNPHDSLGIFMILFPLRVAYNSLVQRPDVRSWILQVQRQLVVQKGFKIGQRIITAP